MSFCRSKTCWPEQEYKILEGELRAEIRDMRALEAARGSPVRGASPVPTLLSAQLCIEQLQGRLDAAIAQVL
jgi:hypothetical protein